MDHRKLISFLPLVICLLTVEDACGSCVDPLCPPPFLDFMAFFAETLKNIPDLLVDNRTSLDTNCPESVNWTEFNWRLETGSPLPLDPVCSHSTTPSPTGANQSNPSSLGYLTPTKPSVSSDIVSATRGSTEPALTPSYVKDQGGTPNIGMPIGVAIGAAALLLTVIAIIAAVCVRRHKAEKQRKDDLLRRFVSTTSHDVLVNNIETPDTPRVQQTVIILRDSVYQESSTDATLRRPTDNTHAVLVEEKVSDETEAGGGCANKAFDAVEEDLEEDPGYAGSEACQENWENEWNNKFEEALMESNDDLPQDAKDADCKVKINSESQKEKLASRTSSNSSRNTPSLKKKASSPLSSPSAKKSQVLDFRMPSPTRSAAFSADSSSPTKSLTSPFNRPSPSNWQTFNVDQMHGTSSKPTLEKRSPSLTPSSDGPPAYSSPVVLPNNAPPFRQAKQGTSFENPTPPATPLTPSGLPTYTEFMAAKDTRSSPHPEPTPSKKQPRPPPSKQSNLTKAAAAVPSPSYLLKSQSVDSSVDAHPNPWKMQAMGSGKANSEPDKPANTAVVRPWTAGKGQASDGGQSAVPSGPASNPVSAPASTLRTPASAPRTPAATPTSTLRTPASTPRSPASTPRSPASTPRTPESTPRTQASTPRADAAAEVTPSDSVGEYSFRPVRSLLSQFETLDKKNP